MDALNCLHPTREPKATDHIPEMVNMISRIMQAGHAYESDGSVWFSVDSIEGFGRLSGRTLVRPLAFICAAASKVPGLMRMLPRQSCVQRQ